MTTQELRNEIVSRLSAKKPLKVILFGSLARGNLGPESDVDLIVVLDKEGIPRFQGENRKFSGSSAGFLGI